MKKSTINHDKVPSLKSLVIKEKLKAKRFDQKLYGLLDNSFAGYLPVSFQIKHLTTMTQGGQSYAGSLYLFLALQKALNPTAVDLAWAAKQEKRDLALALKKVSIVPEHEIRLVQGKVKKRPWTWVETHKHVLDPAVLTTYDKKAFYEYYQPTLEHSQGLNEFLADEGCREIFTHFATTTLADFQPHGDKRTDLCVSVPLWQGMAKLANLSGNPEFQTDLDAYLERVQYHEKQVATQTTPEVDKSL